MGHTGHNTPSQGGPMEMQVHQTEQGIHILRLAGRWDGFSATAFEDWCTALVDKGMRQVIIDCTSVDYVSSFGLRSLLKLGKHLDTLGGVVRISALQPQIRKVFVGSGFDRLFPEYPDLAAALAAFALVP